MSTPKQPDPVISPGLYEMASNPVKFFVAVEWEQEGAKLKTILYVEGATAAVLYDVCEPYQVRMVSGAECTATHPYGNSNVWDGTGRRVFEWGPLRNHHNTGTPGRNHRNAFGGPDWTEELVTIRSVTLLPSCPFKSR